MTYSRKPWRKRDVVKRLNRFLAIAACCAAVCAQPQPPCGTPAVPAYPEPGTAAVVRVWQNSDWTPAPCTGWPKLESATLVATAARFSLPGGDFPLHRRIGAVSAMRGLLYWSTSHQSWQPLILDAYALTAPDGVRRKDFSPEEIAAGRTLYVLQEDNLLGKVVYETRITGASADRVVLTTRNASAVRYFGVPLFQPGDIQSITFLDRDPKDVWRYYAVLRLPRQASLLTMGHDASLINRAVALFRYLAGIPADRDPPAAR
jgi:hypothetical protein